MNSPALLTISEARRDAERRRADELEHAVRTERKTVRRMLLQCIALSFAGVPIYALAWAVEDLRFARLAITAGFLVSYGLPFFRWLHYHATHSDNFI